MTDVGVVNIPDNKEWVKQLKSAPVVHIAGPSQTTTNRGIVSLLRIRKRKKA